MNFWNKLPKPFFCQAPMADVTDSTFRKIIAKYSNPAGPDIMWTEFVSADGLVHPKGKEKLLADLKYSAEERPIVAQLFSSNPENMEQAAALCVELGFNGIDINMGCPDRTIEKQGCGAAMIKDPERAIQIIDAARRGAGSIPVTVKTRLGYNKVDMRWIQTLLDQKLPALTIHLRTRKEMSLVPAHWELMPEIIKLRDVISPETLIIGNGDVKNIEHARTLVAETGCDGVMLGKAIFGNPWLYSEKIPTIVEKLQVMIEHTKLFEQTFDGIKSFSVMKKHYKAYVNDFPGAKELRTQLMECENAKEVEEITLVFLDNTNK